MNTSRFFAAALLAGAAMAQAQGLQGSYTVQGGSSSLSGSSPSSTFNLTQASPVTRAASISVGSGATHGSGSAGIVASADAGLLDILLQATSTSATGSSGAPVNGGLMFTGGGASASFTDMVISGPAGATTVQASLNGNLVISGTVTDVTNANLALRGVNATVTMPGGFAFNVSNTLNSEAFVSVEFTLPVGQPFTLGMSMSIGNTALIAGTVPTAGGSPQAGLTETLMQNATLSLGLTADRLAFGSGGVLNLPSGFTLNSAQANIVGNQWLGPTLPVPEPASGVLMLLGAAVLAARRRAAAR